MRWDGWSPLRLGAGVEVAPLCTALIAALFLYISQARIAEADDLSKFVGSYVGEATVEDLTTGEQLERHLDIVVVPHRQDGLRIDWITVGLVDGRRAVPGVKRWSQTVRFEPEPNDGYLVEVGESDVFREREDMVPMKGDPVRWTRVDGNTLFTSSFVVLEDGRYELQIYQRILTEIGMDIRFERIVDGQTVRRVTGSTARAS
jgi:hypothetical protein